MYRLTVPFVTLALLASSVFAEIKPIVDGAAPGEWTMDLDAARKVASEKKLPLLLNFTGSDWCGWCKLMDKQVFSQEAWQTYAKKNVMLVWLDFPRDKSLVPEKYVTRNAALSEQFGVEGYPTYVVLDDDGKTQLGRLGAERNITAESFIRKLNGVFGGRACVVEQLLKNVSAETAQTYRATAKELADAEEELKTLKASSEKKIEELEERIETCGNKLAGIRTDARLAKLPQEKAAAYKEKQKRLEAVRAELKAWVASSPARNEENQKKYQAWNDEIENLGKELSDLLEE